MSNKEKMKLLEDMLELDEGVLTEETALDDIEEWNSMASLSFILLMNNSFHKTITAKQMRTFKTIKDICDYME